MSQLSNCCDAPPLGETFGVMGRCGKCLGMTLFYNDEKPDPTMEQVDCDFCDCTGVAGQIDPTTDIEIPVECPHCKGRGWNEYDEPIDDDKNMPSKIF